jgi:hypothetical protein
VGNENDFSGDVTDTLDTHMDMFLDDDRYALLLECYSVVTEECDGQIS